MSYLLDTNSVVNHMRHARGSRVTENILAAPAGTVHICSIVLAELYYGANKSDSTFQSLNLSLILDILRDFPSLPFDDRAAEEYGKIRHDLTKRGLLIGSNDMLIASIALANQMILVTHNLKEFERIPGLICEDWQ